jgi:hypothetical protein
VLCAGADHGIFITKGRERAAFGSALSFDKGSRWQEIGL